MYGSIFDCHTPAGGTAGILWVEARDAVKYPIAHQAAPHRELSGCQCQWCHGGEVLLESEVGMTVPGPHLALVFLTLLILFLQKECDEGWKPLFKMMPPWAKSSESDRQIPYDNTYMWNFKNDTNELIYEAETDSQTENKLMVPERERGWKRDKLGVWD